MGIKSASKARRGSSSQKKARTDRKPRAIESLEPRMLFYAVSGNAWSHPELITISFMPDGTNLGGTTSNLFSAFNSKFGSSAAWQKQILKAAQFWAQQTNINFAVVSDDGAASGSGYYQQGAEEFGDIRIGGYNFGSSTLAQSYLPPPVNNYSAAGDIRFNTGAAFHVGTTYDLFTVAVHEIGHALGLYHATSSYAEMFSSYTGLKSSLMTDDINGIRAIYTGGGARTNDAYDAVKSNGSTGIASVITSLINPTTHAAVINNLDLTTTSDLDFYKVVVPVGASSTLKVKVQSQGLSLLDPTVKIIGTGGYVLATAQGSAYGTTGTATLSGITAGKTYYIEVLSSDAIGAFKTGKYALIVNMGSNADPAVTMPDTEVECGTPLSSGGGQAVRFDSDVQVNTSGDDNQETSRRAVASSSSGNFVVTWASHNQDGSGWGVYGRLYDAGGVPQTGEFLINTTTLSDQVDPVAAMDAQGNFVVVWTSQGQDGDGDGIYAQRFNTNGVQLGSEFRINNTTAGDQSAPSVAMDSAGNFVVTWTSVGHGANSTGIYARQFNASGVAIGNEFRVNSTAYADQTNSTVAVNQATGAFVVAWQGSNHGNSGYDIYARQFNSQGVSQGNDFRVNSTTLHDQTDPSITCSTQTGNWVVSWTGSDVNGSGVFAKWYNASGDVVTYEAQVNTTTKHDQSDSSVAIGANGNAIITWSGKNDKDGSQIFGQLFTASGKRNEAEFIVNDTVEGNQAGSAATVDNLGQIVVVWSGSGGPDTSGVYFQRFRTDLDFLESGATDTDARSASSLAGIWNVLSLHGSLGGAPIQSAVQHTQSVAIDPQHADIVATSFDAAEMVSPSVFQKIVAEGTCRENGLADFDDPSALVIETQMQSESVWEQLGIG